MPKIQKPMVPQGPYDSECIPQFNEEAERAVLGSIIYEPKAFRKVIKEGLSVEAFYLPAHRIIYEAILDLSNAGQHPDIVLIGERLKNTGKLKDVGGVLFINRLIDDTPTASSVLHYLKILKGKHKRRELATLSKQTLHDAMTSDESEEDLLSKAKFAFHKISFVKEISESVLEITRRLALAYRKAKSDIGHIGLRSRWSVFQHNILGYPEGKVTVVAGRPGEGKTAFAFNEGLFQALTKHPTLIITIEMTKEEVVERLISDLMGLDLNKFKDCTATYQDHEQFIAGGEIIASLPIYIEEGLPTIEQISSLVREYREEHGIELCVIDYIQIIASTPGVKFQNRNAELSHMSQINMHLAKETKVHIMMLSQLTRFEGVGKFKIKEPELHHLRDCGAIEQDAYMVIMIFQDPDEEENWDDNAPTIFKVVKRRGGFLSRTEMVFEKTKVRFTGIDKFSLRQILKDEFPKRPQPIVEKPKQDEGVPF